jgi:hypothetical protein
LRCRIVRGGGEYCTGEWVTASGTGLAELQAGEELREDGLVESRASEWTGFAIGAGVRKMLTPHRHNFEQILTVAPSSASLKNSLVASSRWLNLSATPFSLMGRFFMSSSRSILAWLREPLGLPGPGRLPSNRV